MMWLNSGALIDSLALPEELARGKVTLLDVGWALAHINRWTGHANPAISVGWHTLVCAEAAMFRSPLLGLLALHHDDGEAFFGDMARDLKCHPEMGWYREQEHRATQACVDYFAPACRGINLQSIKEFDTGSLLWERDYVLRGDKVDADWHPEVEVVVPSDSLMRVLSDPESVFARWVDTHDRLTRRV